MNHEAAVHGPGLPGAIDTGRLPGAINAAKCAWVGRAWADMAAQVGKGLTPLEVTHLRDMIEFLIVDVTRLSDYTDYRNDDVLFELHNALIWRIWQELDRLAMWAGGFRRWGRHAHWSEPCGSGADCARYQHVAAFNRLLAEVEPDAHIAAIELEVHNADGTVVTYTTGIDDNPMRPQQPLCRVVHNDDHTNCVAVDEDRPIADDSEPA